MHMRALGTIWIKGLEIGVYLVACFRTVYVYGRGLRGRWGLGPGRRWSCWAGSFISWADMMLSYDIWRWSIARLGMTCLLSNRLPMSL